MYYCMISKYMQKLYWTLAKKLASKSECAVDEHISTHENDMYIYLLCLKTASFSSSHVPLFNNITEHKK